MDPSPQRLGWPVDPSPQPHTAGQPALISFPKQLCIKLEDTNTTSNTKARKGLHLNLETENKNSQRQSNRKFALKMKPAHSVFSGPLLERQGPLGPRSLSFLFAYGSSPLWWVKLQFPCYGLKSLDESQTFSPPHLLLTLSPLPQKDTTKSPRDGARPALTIHSCFTLPFCCLSLFCFF